MKSIRCLNFFVMTLLLPGWVGSHISGAPVSVAETIAAKLPEWVEFYQDLHANPELSFDEFKTARKIAEKLKISGFSVTENIGGTGVVGVFENGEGPVLLIRTDMDALPIKEDTGLPFGSKVESLFEDGNRVGVMHACGHDVHMTVATWAAAILAKWTDQWKGTLVVIGQPAEEKGAGAKAMLEAGLYEDFPLPDYCIALHVSPDLPTGTFGFTEGFSMANVDSVDILVRGMGGHGAIPQDAIDPIVMASQMVIFLQTIVSRELDPLDPAVVTVGSIHGGSKHNVIPDEVKLQLTVRTYSDAVREKVLRRIGEIAEGVARTAGVPEERLPVVSVKKEYTPSLYNDPGLTRRLRHAFAEKFGAGQIRDIEPVMVGEDFGRYGRTEEKVPICMFRLGTTDPALIESETPVPGLHSSGYAPQAALSISAGVEAMVTATLELLPK